MFALFLKAERISPEEAAADKVHHFSLSLGSWGEFHQFKLSGTSAVEVRF